MAKKKKSPLVTTTPIAALAVAANDVAEPTMQVITVPPGATLFVIVDVGPMAVPYAVSYAGKTLIKSLVDRAEQVALLPGDQVLAWSFAHTVKGWNHTIGIALDDGASTVLETKSEANKDQDHSVNFAIVRA